MSNIVNMNPSIISKSFDKDERCYAYYKETPHLTSMTSIYHDDGMGGPPVRHNCFEPPYDYWEWINPNAIIYEAVFELLHEGVVQKYIVTESNRMVYINHFRASLDNEMAKLLLKIYREGKRLQETFYPEWSTIRPYCAGPWWSRP